jgi:hypothetical protein
MTTTTAPTVNARVGASRHPVNARELRPEPMQTGRVTYGEESGPSRGSSRFVTPSDVAEFGIVVYEHGLDKFPHEVRELARDASHVAPIAAAVLTDADAALVVRQRAFAKASTALARHLDDR